MPTKTATKLGILLLCLLSCAIIAWGRASRNCSRKPTISGLCLSSTLGIFYDTETQRCKYMGCSPDKKLFSSLEECERICNSPRQRARVTNTVD